MTISGINIGDYTAINVIQIFERIDTINNENK